MRQHVSALVLDEKPPNHWLNRMYAAQGGAIAILLEKEVPTTCCQVMSQQYYTYITGDIIVESDSKITQFSKHSDMYIKVHAPVYGIMFE